MIYEFFDEDHHVLLMMDEREDGYEADSIVTPAGVTIMPVARADVIVSLPDGPRLVYEANYGSLPNGALVVMVRNSSGTFPEEATVEARIVFEPYDPEDA